MEIIENSYLAADDDSRFSITFLDLADSSFAINDEVMIDKKNGKIYYKKPDGTIVPSTESISTTTVNMIELDSAINRNIKKLIYPDINTIMVTMEHRVVTKESLNAIVPASLEGFIFRSNKDTNGFFLEVNTRRSDINTIEMLQFLYNKKHPDNVMHTNATLNFKVKYVDSVGTEAIRNTSVDIKLNMTELIIIDAASTITELTNISYIEVTLESVESELIKEMLVDTSYTSLAMSNNGDGDILIETFDVSAFVDSLDGIPNDANTTIINVYNTSSVIDNMKDIGGAKDLEGLLPKVVRTASSLPNGDVMPTLSLVIDEVVMEDGDIV